MKYQSKVDLVYNSIRADMERGVYLPGDRINISRVAKLNDCSEIPVREALRKLQSERLVELIPNRGAVVSTVKGSYLRQVFDVKILLETHAAALSVDKATPAQIKKLRRIAEQVLEAYRSGNLKKCAQLNHKFHISLYQMSGNDVLVDYIDQLWNSWPIGRFSNYVSDAWYQASIQQHFDMLDAIEAKDKERVTELIRMHKSGALADLNLSARMAAE